jgi:uncharacterized protein (TIGR03083 family)
MNRLHATKDFWLAGLRADGPAFRAAVVESRPDAPVPTCPDWTVEHMVRHLGALYAWVTGHVRRGVLSVPDPGGYDLTDAPAGAGALPYWDEQYAHLIQVFDGLDPETPAWNPMPQTKNAAFWIRRIAHDTSIHRWDAQMAAVGMAEPVEAKLAADGVAEVLDTLLPAGRRRSPVDRRGVVHIVATDASHEWFVRLRGEGIALLDTGTLLDTDDHHARVMAAGTASDLLLGLYGRVGFDMLDVTGDITLLEALRTG